MPTKDSQIISIRVNRKELNFLKERAEKEAKSLSELLKESMQEVKRETEIEEVSEKIIELAFVHSMTPIGMLNSLDYLLKKKMLYVKDGGISFHSRPEDYVSVDEAIDSMDAPEWRKKSLKESILKNLNVSFDDTGNGGGL